MFTRKISAKPIRPTLLDEMPDTALAAIMPYKKEQDVNEFIGFVLDALDRNAQWINNLVGRQRGFKCAIMVGAGPNRFHIHQMVYPNQDEKFTFEIECRDSEDYDKIAIAALLKLTNTDVDRMLKHIKTRFFDQTIMKEELLKGKAMGMDYAVLRPLYGNDKQYRLMERINISNSIALFSAPVKRRIADKSSSKGPFKRLKKEIAS